MQDMACRAKNKWAQDIIRKTFRKYSTRIVQTKRRTAVAQWLKCCVTNRTVVGSIPAVSGFFIDIKSFRSHYGAGVDSASNRNEYQKCFLGVKAAGA